MKICRRNRLIAIWVFMLPFLVILSVHVAPKPPPNINCDVYEVVTLPCSIPLGIQPQNVVIQWKKHFDDHMEDVYQYTAVTGHEIFGQGYQDRIMFSKEGLITRNVSLKLEPVRVADEGVYVCIVNSSDGKSTTEIVLHLSSVKGHDSSDCSLWFLASLALLMVVIAAAITYSKCKEKQKNMDRKRSEELTSLISENLQAENGTLKEEHDMLKEQHGMLKEQHGVLKEKHEQIKEENKHLRTGNTNVMLNPKTAHPRLAVSEDGKSVRDTGDVLKVPYCEERFDSHMFVLAKEGFLKGKRYWEVEVGLKKSWDLGVASESISRKGRIMLAPQNGYWVIGLDGNKDFWARTDPWTSLKVSGKPTKIGIYLDMSASIYSLSFHDIHRKRLLHKFTIQCSGKL